jgi:hypothetical protein
MHIDDTNSAVSITGCHFERYVPNKQTKSICVSYLIILLISNFILSCPMIVYQQ